MIELVKTNSIFELLASLTNWLVLSEVIALRVTARKSFKIKFITRNYILYELVKLFNKES
jgi:hypothetical protein